MEKNKRVVKLAPWLCLGIMLWIIFKNPIAFLVFLALGVFLDKKKNKKEEFFKTMNEYSKEIEIEFSDEQLEKFYTYMKLLLEWNEKINLTAITEDEEVVMKAQFSESKDGFINCTINSADITADGRYFFRVYNIYNGSIFSDDTSMFIIDIKE